MKNQDLQLRYNLEDGLALRRSSGKDIKRIKEDLLTCHLRHACSIPFYQERFKSIGISNPENIDADIFTDLPFTSRLDIDNNADFFGIKDGENVTDIAMTSGTTGIPVIVPYTSRDLHRLAYNEAISYYSAGVRQNDRVLLTVTLDRCFIAGLAYYSGVTMLGASAIRSGPGQLPRQWQIIEALKPSVIVGVPSFLLELALWGKEHGKNVSGCGIDTITSIGEPIRKYDYQLTGIGSRLEEIWGAKVYSSYGATEFECAFGECPAGEGGHVHPDLMVVEIIDDDGNILPEGRPGEIVVTPLGVEGFPLVRFRTGDIGRLDSSPCRCGWNTKRLGPVEGRLAQRLKVKGTTFYPDSILYALQEHNEIVGSYVEVRSLSDGADDVTVVIGSDDLQLDTGSIEENLQAHLRVKPKLQVKSSAEVKKTMTQDGGRKPKKYFDFRT